MPPESPYRMTLTLNVLNHLGLNLYSNVPAVIAEVVANSWDADAETVDIKLADDSSELSVTDNGEGMDLADVNEKYLTVGYARREAEETKITPKHHREVMGRKGIGKLSLFSVANVIELYTVKKGEHNAFRMNVEDIKARITEERVEYSPEVIRDWPEDLRQGSRIVLKNLKKDIRGEDALRRRLARRFSIIGDEFEFSVAINGKPISIEDRDYYGKVQFVWWYGDKSARFRDLCLNRRGDFKRPSTVAVNGTKYEVEGWIGTVERSTQLKDKNDNLNKILLMVRGKLAEEDLLENFTEGGVYTKYLIGEIHAGFIDLSEKPDITTSSRQKIIEDDPRYRALQNFLHPELKQVENAWTDLRIKEGVEKALKVPAIEKWFKTLKGEKRKRAEALFGKINQLTIDSEEDKRTLFKHSILAFESLSYKENLDALEAISPENLEEFTKVLGQLDDIEATMYHQIVTERIEVIEALQEKVERDVLEKLIQQHIFKHLWLLDPAWERATENPFMERSVAAAFGKIDAKLSKEERKGRLDIKYKASSGKHIIVELKRADIVVTTPDLMAQVDKYRSALGKVLKAAKVREPIEVVCVLGRPPKDWDGDNQVSWERSLHERDIRVVQYAELIKNASASYSAYLEKHKEVGRVLEIIKSLEVS